jgi:CBS domain-containing protein
MPRRSWTAITSTASRSWTPAARARATQYLWSNWPGLAVRHLMTSPAITVHRSTPLAIAARKMERHRIHRLVVVDDQDETVPIGVISMTDLVHSIVEETAADAVPAAGDDGADGAE